MGFGYDNEGKQLVEKTSIDKITGEFTVKRNHTHVSDFYPLIFVQTIIFSFWVQVMKNV
jgi:hypothetical protein